VKEVFADSYYFLALLNPRDEGHRTAVAAAESLKAPLVTTAWVLTELADGMAGTADRETCVGFMHDLRQRSGIRVLPASQELSDAGWALYESRPDKEWSLTDCISFRVMEGEGIREALTGDRHFEQAGFRALL
jgi:predicted nucleic acid-binding protein